VVRSASRSWVLPWWQSGQWEWGLLYRGRTVGKDLGTYRGVVKPYRGRVQRSGRWLNYLVSNSTYSLGLFPPGVDNRGKRRSNLKKRQKYFSQRPYRYKRPRYGLGTPWCVPRSFRTVRPRYNKPHSQGPHSTSIRRGKFPINLSPSGRIQQVENTTRCHNSGTMNLNSIGISTVREGNSGQLLSKELDSGD